MTNQAVDQTIKRGLRKLRAGMLKVAKQLKLDMNDPKIRSEMSRAMMEALRERARRDRGVDSPPPA